MVTEYLHDPAVTQTAAPKAAASLIKVKPVNVESLPSCAADWQGPIRTDGRWFKDEAGRYLLLRGVNLCGSSKLPTRPYPGSTHLYDEQLFWDHRGVSFVDRPFPLANAREHLARLRAWGLTLVRLLIPWESIEHAGPGEYDEEYIEYLRQLISLMPDYGIKCFIDPHQDTWSRFSGGSGAPGWTFEVAGMNIRHFKETGAAYVHNTNAVPGDPLPMVWPTNYSKLASCTMFTLFFGGDTFAPNAKYQGKPIQQFLSQCFIDAFAHLAKRLRDLDAVLGFEVMNEPHPGYIGMKTLKEFDPIVNLIFGDAPTPLQSFALGDGIPKSRIINASKTSAWLPNHSCIWRQHGVWGLDAKGKPALLDPAYFAKHPTTGEPVDFYRDFYVPFVNRYAKAIQRVKPEWYCFVEPLANESSPVFTEKDHHDNMVYAPHWYDLNCVFYKKFDGRITHDVQSLQKGGNVISATYFGRKGAKSNYRGQIKNIKASGLKNMGEKPCLLGEVGIPMDINERAAFHTGDYKNHVHFLDAVIHALEVNLVNFTLWNYDVCNDNEYGDHWNGENFSIYSTTSTATTAVNPLESLTTLQDEDDAWGRFHNGGRVLEAAVRPYASKVAGIPERSEFLLDSLEYRLVFQPKADATSELATTTEIYVPHYHYNQAQDLDIKVSHGEYTYSPETQTLYHRYKTDTSLPTHISISLKLPLFKKQRQQQQQQQQLDKCILM
ncbi:glycoside hydrolase superfamily [Syncephalastrum racemosum]|uniref:Glycoside hydrolase superfamily n=1 Tax=Syncephalastrum racemosum TaxID=13706 RepID=A0A1X2H4G2_SYNRA|nr:glycoside hydrolase superfamily [Syncephalastrum racemosum]